VSSTPDIDALTRLSDFIFSGTVQDVGASNVGVVEPGDTTVTVRVDRGFRSDPALGDIRGRLVTVETSAADDLPAGTQAVFLTNSWVHGDQIAVRDRAHFPADQVDAVADAVSRLPDMHLADRLRAAAAVVHVAVVRVQRVAGLDEDHRAPLWAEASLDVLDTLKGDPSGKRLVFPTSDSHRWYLAPRPTAGQRCVILLHVGDPAAGNWLDEPELVGAVTALDHADVQPGSEADHVRTLLAGLEDA
jgi:hypothetical protein